MPPANQQLAEFVPGLRDRDVSALAEALRECIEPVVDEHVGFLRRRIPEAARLDDAGLTDDLREVLLGMVDALTESDRKLTLTSPAHGIARFAQGFEVEQLGVEYSALRTVLARHVRRRLRRPLTDVEAECLHGLVDFVASRVTSSFQHQREKGIRVEADSITRFLSALAHDLRNVLNTAMLTMQVVMRSVRTAAELPAGGPAPPADLERLVLELENSQRLIRSTIDGMTRLLEAERLRVGSFTIRPEAVAVVPLLESIRRAVWPGGTPESARVTIEAPADLVVHTDYSLLSTVLLNLAANAAKYGGGRPVVLRAARTDGGACRIEVVDRGPGMPPEEQQRIFERYYRAMPEAADGLGLGLFTAKRAAESMAARLGVESAVGAGSTFWIEIPREPPRPAARSA